MEEARVERRGMLSLLAWLAALAAGLALFHSMGTGPLASPALHRPAAWTDWAAQREPITAVVALLRLVVLALAWYLLGVTAIGLLTRLLRARRFIRVADAVTIPPVRRFLQGAVGLGLATAVVAASVPAVTRTAALGEGAAVAARAELRDVPKATLRSLDEAGPEDEEHTERGDLGARLLPDGPAQPPTSAQDEAVRLLNEAATLRALPAEEATHDVRPGESFWSIAQDTLAAAWEREPSDADVLDYWRALIEQNRAELVDPDNPDLIFPDQRLHLPAVPERRDRGNAR